MTTDDFDALVEQAKRNVYPEVLRRVERYLALTCSELVETEVDRLLHERAL